MSSFNEGEDSSEARKIEAEAREADNRRSPSGRIVYKAVLGEAEEELGRSSAALFWSGIAAGLSMGFSLIAQGLLRHHLPDAPWAPLLVKLGYAAGFVLVILGRQQLFTENTLTPVLPLLQRRDRGTLLNVLRLWSVVLLANLLGALAIGLVLARSEVFEPEVRRQFVAVGREALRSGFAGTMFRAVFAGWLIAMLVWMLPAAESARLLLIVAVTWLVGLGHFSHIVAGAVDVFSPAWAGQASWGTVLWMFIAPTLLGNIIGGVTLVAALNHAQVAAGTERWEV